MRKMEEKNYLARVDVPNTGMIIVRNVTTLKMAKMLLEEIEKQLVKAGKKAKPKKVVEKDDEPSSEPIESNEPTSFTLKLMRFLWKYPDSSPETIFDMIDKRGIKPRLTLEVIEVKLIQLQEIKWIIQVNFGVENEEELYAVTEEGRINCKLQGGSD